ncbi:hypothetical protein HYALB_00007127 [Hymenoscyphus albidus]|uniref:Cytochrome c oxidase assembly protein COX20, mitochondrial n=1 Tax=Hymenoscyphus albidus TaxID=595503 RepID=A0A9N9Q247_9HELO|nr:hypothetical protein HYALB_00007127 [Hymenoscyphus albidus]
MAGDTRDSSTPSPRGPPPGETSPPAHVQTPPKVYEVFSSPKSANALPEGSGQNTAGSNPEVPKLVDAVKTVQLEDFKKVHLYPCVRESLLTGMGGAFGMGAIRVVWGSPVSKITNWAVGTFVLVSLGSHEFCQYRRTLEKAYMKRAVEIIDRKKSEKEAEAKLKRDERRRLKEELDKKAEEAAKRSSWKFW